MFKLDVRIALIILAASLPLWPDQAGAAPPVSVEMIAESLSDADKRLTDIRFGYKRECFEKDGQRLIAEGQIAYRKSDDATLIQSKQYRLDPSTDVISPISDSVTCFNGKSTSWLNNTRWSAKKSYRSIVLPGRSNGLLTRQSPAFSSQWVSGNAMYVKMLKNPAIQFEIDGAEQVENESAIRLKGKVADGKEDVLLWVVPDKGYVPIKMACGRLQDGRGTVTTRSDLVQLENGVWYPRRVTIGSVDSPDPKEICLFTDVSSDRLTDEAFRIKFPVNTRVTDHVLNTTYTLDRDDDMENVSAEPSRIPASIVSASYPATAIGLKMPEVQIKEPVTAPPTAAPVAPASIQQPAEHAQRPSGRAWVLVLAAALLATSLAVYLFFVRHQGSRRPKRRFSAEDPSVNRKETEP